MPWSPRRPHALFAPSALVGLLALFVLVDPAMAADGFPVCNADGAQESPSMAVATDGATWVAWLDWRRGAKDIYVARLPLAPAPIGGNAAPPPPPEADGFPVYEGGDADPPIVVPSDSGSVLVFWGQLNTDAVVVQRLRADESTYPGWPAGGKVLFSQLDFADGLLAACTDGNGGAYFAWRRWQNPELRWGHIQRIDSFGQLLWSGRGPAVAGDSQIRGASLAYDPTGGVTTAVRTSYDAQFDGNACQAARVTSVGVVTISQPLPFWRSYGSAPDVNDGRAVGDGAGGMVAAWDNEGHLFAQRWDAAGVKQWPDSLRIPCLNDLLADGAGGHYVSGHDRESPSRLIALRLDGTGSPSPGWDPGGEVLADNQNAGPVGSQPLDNGIFAYWAVTSGGGTGYDIRAMALRDDGYPHFGWEVDGNVLCDQLGNQRDPVSAPGASMVAWVDERDGLAERDIWAASVTLPVGYVAVPPVPSAPGMLRIRSVFPNPATGQVGVSLSLRPNVAARIDLYDLRGRLVTEKVIAAGAGEAIASIPTQGLPVGLYWIRVHQEDETAHARVTVVR